MPITVPVAGTEISATNFGAPVANAVNQLQAFKPFGGTVVANITQTGLGNNVTTVIAGLSLSYTFQSTHNYRVDGSLTIVPSIAGQWLFADIAIPGVAANLLSGSAGAAGTLYGHVISGWGFIGASCAEKPTFGSPITLQMKGNAVGGTWSVQGWCRIAVTDLGLP